MHPIYLIFGVELTMASSQIESVAIWNEELWQVKRSKRIEWACRASENPLKTQVENNWSFFSKFLWQIVAF